MEQSELLRCDRADDLRMFALFHPGKQGPSYERRKVSISAASAVGWFRRLG